jgi:hypothetical protein
MDVAFKLPPDAPIPDMLESPIFMPDMLVSFICDIWLFIESPVSVTVCPTCPASESFELVTFHDFPSFETSLKVPGLSPF